MNGYNFYNALLALDRSHTCMKENLTNNCCIEFFSHIKWVRLLHEMPSTIRISKLCPIQHFSLSVFVGRNIFPGEYRGKIAEEEMSNSSLSSSPARSSISTTAIAGANVSSALIVDELHFPPDLISIQDRKDEALQGSYSTLFLFLFPTPLPWFYFKKIHLLGPNQVFLFHFSMLGLFDFPD